MVGLDDLKVFFQPKQVYDSKKKAFMKIFAEKYPPQIFCGILLFVSTKLLLAKLL